MLTTKNKELTKSLFVGRGSSWFSWDTWSLSWSYNVIFLGFSASCSLWTRHFSCACSQTSISTHTRRKQWIKDNLRERVQQSNKEREMVNRTLRMTMNILHCGLLNHVVTWKLAGGTDSVVCDAKCPTNYAATHPSVSPPWNRKEWAGRFVVAHF